MLSNVSEINRDYAQQAVDVLPGASYSEAVDIYWAMLNDPNLDNTVLAHVGLYDRYFFIMQILNLGNVIERAWHPWLYDRCREVEADPDGYIDLWAREHFKSTLITFGGALQEIAKDPEITIGIFSHNAKHSRSNFVVRIKTELETNALLPLFYPDSFYKNPRKESPVWSRNEGLVCKRKSNPAEPTVSGHGLVDGQPVGSHFSLMIYDDVVTDKSVSTPEMIIKTTEMWDLSQFLGKERADGSKPRVWYIGTRYNYADTYKTILDRGVATPRIYPATDTGTPEGNPVFLEESQWEEKKRSRSPYVIACQMLQNPLAGSEAEFQLEWVRRYELRPEVLNVAILCDPASSKKKWSSDTAMVVVGIDGQFNKYLLDGAIHKMSLSEKWIMLKGLRKKWLRQPGVQTVRIGYEKYAHQSDIEHYQQMMRIEGESFPIETVSWPRDMVEGSKHDRIRRLIPDHQNWKFFYPYDGQKTRLQQDAEGANRGHLVSRAIKRENEDGRIYDVTEYLVNSEILFFPATTKLDGLDALSRFYDLDMQPPMVVDETDVYPEYVGDD